MTKPLSDYINGWITLADHDLLNAQTVIKHEPIVLDTACFHCQQASEKYLKAFLHYHNINIGKTHDILFLLAECARIDTVFKEIDVKDMNEFAVDIRYPDEYVSPTMDEAKYYFNIASEIKKHVLKRIRI